MTTLDLNADLGEGIGDDAMGEDGAFVAHSPICVRTKV